MVFGRNFDELVEKLADEAERAYTNRGGVKAAKLGDFRDDSYREFGGGEKVEQGVVDNLQARGFVVGNAPQGFRIFARTQAEIDTYEAATGIDTTPDA